MPWFIRFAAAARPACVIQASDALSVLHHLATEQHMALVADISAPELIQQRGHLYLYRDSAQFRKDAAGWKLCRHYSGRVETLDRAGIVALEPAVSPTYTLGQFLPDHAHCVDPHRYCLAIAAALTAAGGQILRDQVTEVMVAAGRAVGARGRQRYDAETVVVAAGAWSARLLAPLGLGTSA